MMCEGAHENSACGGQRTIFGSQFSPSSMGSGELRLASAYQLRAQQALLLIELFYSVINFTNPLSSPLSLLKQLPQH